MTNKQPREEEVQDLVQQYKEEHDWDTLLSAAKQTSEVVRTLAEAVLTENLVNTDSMTVLKRLCQHSGRYPVDSKIRDVKELDIPEDVKNKLEAEITESVGSVGGTFLEVTIPEEYEDDAHDFLEVLLTETDKDVLDAAIEDFASLDISGLQTGRLSPIIHYLHPTKYPIVNGQSIPGIETYFGRDISNNFNEYLSAVDEFESVRDEYGFNDHFRHLDWFFIWAERQEETGYFILRTGSDEYSDSPSEEYHFREGIPGSSQIREFGNIRAIYSEDGEFYATAKINNIISEERDGETHYYAKVSEYDEIEPVSITDVRSEVNQSLSVQYGIIKITEEDYQTIIGGDTNEDTRYFWVNKKPPTEWPENQKELFYKAETSDGTAHSMKSAYQRARPGDKVIIYYLAPEKKIAGLGRIVEGLHTEEREGYDEPVKGIRIAGEQAIDGPTRETMFNEPRLQNATPISAKLRMILGELDQAEYEAILDMADEHSPNGNGDTDITSLQEWVSPPQISLSLPDELYFDNEDDLKRQIEATLNSGKHIIFTGPPGTGKTKLAKEIAKQCAAQYPEHIDDYRFTTATSAWTTFDTIGGYVPQQQGEGDKLVFQPRIFLNCFREDDIRNDWLVIDEINRSDIDKAFGQLFSVLSGDTVELPYERNEPVEIVSLDSNASNSQLTEIVQSDDLFPVTPSWRLLATMNTYDKASLYELSYAFMRRFNFIHVGVPNLQNTDGEIRTSLLDPNTDKDTYATKWASEGEEIERALQDTYKELAVVWKRINEARSIGPSIVRDILAYIAANDTDDSTEALLTDAIIALVYPQLEGMRPQEQKQLIESLSADAAETETGDVNVELEQKRLRRKAEDIFNIEFSDDE